MNTGQPIDHVLAKFPQRTQTGGQWLVRCPAHEDRKASLALREGDDGRVLLHCHAGCHLTAILDALGLKESDLFPPRQTTSERREVATYDYRDETGTLLYQVVRFEPKDFRQRCPSGAGGWTWKLNGVRRVPYRLPDLNGKVAVVICEGEKDCETLWAANIPATTNAGGAGKWLPTYAELLKAAGVQRVRILPDNDLPGRDHAATVLQSCLAVGLEARIVTLQDVPEKGDVSDFLSKHSVDEFKMSLRDAPAPQTATPGSLSQLLQDLGAYIRKYVVVSDEQRTAVCLWVLHTHGIEAFETTPYLQVSSATKRAGKTRLLEVLEPVVARPWFTGRTSAAALVRKVDHDQPTLLLDESDAAFGGEKEYAEALRGILNSGYRRSGRVTLCVGQGANLSYKDFVTFGPKAIAGIGTLPDTIADRSIPIRLQRKTTDEPCARWRQRDGHQDAAPLHQACIAWATPRTVETCRTAKPSLPATLGDRQADVWEPLLAIADLAGGEWPHRARNAAVRLAGTIEDTDVTVELLSDIRDHVLETHEDTLIATKILVQTLTALEDRPWASWRHDKPITARAVARLLGPLGIYPTATMSVRGYRRDAFIDAIARYLPSNPSYRHEPNKNGSELAFSKRHGETLHGGLKMQKTPMNTERYDAMTVRSRNASAGAVSEPPDTPSTEPTVDPSRKAVPTSNTSKPEGDGGDLWL